MAEAHYQRTEPPHCPTCSCGMTGDPCPHVAMSRVYSETGNVGLCDDCGAEQPMLKDPGGQLVGGHSQFDRGQSMDSSIGFVCFVLTPMIVGALGWLLAYSWGSE